MALVVTDGQDAALSLLEHLVGASGLLITKQGKDVLAELRPVNLGQPRGPRTVWLLVAPDGSMRVQQPA